jgi:hypothetical protein
MGFASALILAAAILVHGYARPVANVQASPAMTTAQIEQRIRTEVDQRVNAEVAQVVSKVVSDSQAREAKATLMLDAAEKRFERQRESDIATIRETAQETAHYWQNKMGQLMVASNRTYGGAQ